MTGETQACGMHAAAFANSTSLLFRCVRRDRWLSGSNKFSRDVFLEDQAGHAFPQGDVFVLRRAGGEKHLLSRVNPRHSVLLHPSMPLLQRALNADVFTV